MNQKYDKPNIKIVYLKKQNFNKTKTNVDVSPRIGCGEICNG